MLSGDDLQDDAVRELRCGLCGKPATCIGLYPDHDRETCPYENCKQHDDEPACDECCGHGCEDGSCEPLYYDHEDFEIDPACRPRVAAYLTTRAGKGE